MILYTLLSNKQLAYNELNIIKSINVYSLPGELGIDYLFSALSDFLNQIFKFPNYTVK